MKLSAFIANRLSNKNGTSFSRTITRLAVWATALSVAVMIISIAVVLGFKETIKDKMFVFWGHIEIAPFNANPGTIISPSPFEKDNQLIKKISQHPEVVSIYPYLIKPAILQADSLMEGLKIKGVDADYPFKSNDAIQFEGNPISFDSKNYAQQIIISKNTLNKINKNIGDSILVYFLNPDQAYPRVRKLQIAGTFHTGMEEIDANFAMSDIQLLQRVSNWDSTQINGYQVEIKDYNLSNFVAYQLYQDDLEPPMSASTMQDIYPNIFSWLDLMNRNTYIILIIMAIVAVINLSTALLIFILERTPMVGVLKTLGMPMKKIKRIFQIHASKIAIKGILWGNLVGVGFCLIQKYTHIIQLDESAYYMSFVPIQLIFWHVFLVNIFTFLFCIVILNLPLLIIKKINIIQAIKFK